MKTINILSVACLLFPPYLYGGASPADTLKQQYLSTTAHEETAAENRPNLFVFTLADDFQQVKGRLESGGIHFAEVNRAAEIAKTNDIKSKKEAAQRDFQTAGKKSIWLLGGEIKSPFSLPAFKRVIGKSADGTVVILDSHFYDPATHDWVPKTTVRFMTSAQPSSPRSQPGPRK